MRIDDDDDDEPAELEISITAGSATIEGSDATFTATSSRGTVYTVSGTNIVATVAVSDADPTPSGPPTVTVRVASPSEGRGNCVLP